MIAQIALLFIAIVSVLGVPSAVYNPPQPPLNLRGGEVGGGFNLKGGELEKITAPSAFLIDTASGSIFFNKQADEQRPIASITKFMTALVVLDSGVDWSKTIRFEAKDRREGDISYIIPGEEITMADAWNLMLVASSNDAAALLTHMIGNTECFNAQHSMLCNPEEEFVNTMNAKARELGLKHTKFVDPTGLSPENVSTAREVAVLARYALSFSEIRQAVQQSKFIFAPKGKAAREIKSTNQMLKWFQPPNVTMFGGKTGHIEESGYNLVFSAGNKKHELVGVVLGSESNETRFSEMSKLLQWGFNIVQ